MILRLAAAVFLVFAAASAALAQGSISVSLDSPSPFEPAHGQVEIVAVVGAGEEVERVAFYVDGMVVGELESAPYRLSVDVGQENAEHRFQVVAYGVSGATGTTSLSTPSFRVDEEVSLNLQQLYVTVSRNGRRLPGLGREDFAVLDEGSQQQLVTFARGDIPFTAVVLLDSSSSMQGEPLSAALAGAEAFLTNMNRLDEGKLLVFSDRILHTTPFTTFPEVLTAGLGNVTARGGTALNDHLYLAVKQLEDRQGRRVVVLLSDGVDSLSVLSMTDVGAKARRSQALVYWLRLPYRGRFDDGGKLPEGVLPFGEHITSAWRSAEEHRQEFDLLRRTVEESGGRIVPLASIGEIEAAFQDILAELRDQYVLGYYPDRSRHDGSWRRIKVRLRPQGVDVRCRDGYVDF